MRPTNIATASLYFQCVSLVVQSSGEEGFSMFHAAMPYVWLASQMLEEPQKLRDVANSASRPGVALRWRGCPGA